MNTLHATLLLLSDHPWLLALAKGSILLIATGLLFIATCRFRMNAAARHALLLAGCIAALAMPLLSTANMPGLRVTVAAPKPAIATASLETPSGVDFHALGITPADAKAKAATTPALKPATPTHAHAAAASLSWLPTFSLAQSVLWLWLAGAVIVLLPLGMAYARLADQVSRARKVTQFAWTRWLKEEVANLGLRHPVRLYVLPEMGLAPATFGFGRWTCIALPKDALGWPEAEVRLVIKHELAHVRRLDWLAQLAGQIMLAVYWFNPAAWWMSRRMSCKAEFACDNQVVTSGVRATAYAECMVQMAARMSRADSPIGWTTPSMPFVSFLSRRIAMVLESSENRRSLGQRSVWGMAAAALIAAGLVGGMQVAKAEEAKDAAPAPSEKITLKVVSFDSNETDSEDGKAENAVDGDPATHWHTQWSDQSPECPHEIVISMDKAREIHGLSYLPRQDGGENGMIKEYEIYVSADGNDFGKPVAKGTFEKSKDKKIATFDVVNCQFIKLKALSEVNGHAWTSAAEIGVVLKGQTVEAPTTAVTAEAADAADEPKLKVGDAAPVLAPSKWLKGEAVEKFEPGKIYIVEFWATWCGPCKQSIPHLTEMQKKNPDVTIIGMNVMEEDQKGVPAFVEKMGDKMNYRVAMDDADNRMSKAWMEAAGQDGIPTAFIIGKDSKIAWIGHPMEMEDVLKQVVAGTFDGKKFAAEKAADESVLTDAQEMVEQAAQDEKLGEALVKLDQLIKDHPKLADELKDLKFDVLQTQATDAGNIAAIDKLIKDYPDKLVELQTSKFHMLTDKDPAAAIALAKELCESQKDNAELLNEIAWTMVDPEAPFEKADLDLALKAATRASELEKGDNPAVLDTLARIYFNRGDVDKAIELQTKSVAMSQGDEEEKADAEKVLAEYKAKKAGAK